MRGSGRPTERWSESSRSATTPTRVVSIGVSTSPSSMRRPYARPPPGRLPSLGRSRHTASRSRSSLPAGTRSRSPTLGRCSSSAARSSKKERPWPTLDRPAILSTTFRTFTSASGSARMRHTSIRCRCFRRGLPPYLRRRPRRRPHRRRLHPTPRPSRRSERRRPRRISRRSRSLRRRLRLLLSSRLS